MIISVRDHLYNGCKIPMFLCIMSLLNRFISKGKIVTCTAIQTVLLFILIGFTSPHQRCFVLCVFLQLILQFLMCDHE